jgi:hypothetical protein
VGVIDVLVAAVVAKRLDRHEAVGDEAEGEHKHHEHAE